MNTIKKTIKRLSEDIYLFYKGPKEYLYSFTYSRTDKVAIEKYDPEVTKFGQSLIKSISKEYPKLKVNFFGSAALKVAGQRDVDLFVESKAENFDRYLPVFIKLFGKPIKRRREFIEWNFSKNGIDVELLLIDPRSRMLQRQIRAFRLLKNNREEYALLKSRCIGLSSREYEREKALFFYKVGL